MHVDESLMLPRLPMEADGVDGCRRDALEALAGDGIDRFDSTRDTSTIASSSA
jgi:hypothetical protein